MKQTVKIITLILLPVILLSCGWFTDLGQGSVRIDIAEVATRGIGDRYARIYMTADGELFPLDAENAYLAAQVNEFEPTTVIIEGIPVGPRYRVLLSTGFLEDGWFATQQWGESAEFTLEPGINTPVDLFMQGSPFGNTFDLAGKNLRDVFVLGTTLYTTSTDTLYENIDTYPWGAYAPIALEPGYNANSLSEGIEFGSGAARLWINSNKGVLPFYYDIGPLPVPAFDTAFSANLGAVPVLDSATRSVSGGHVVFFHRQDGLGGGFVPTADATKPENWTWVNLDAGGVYDLLCVGPGEGQFATSGGAFRLPEAFLKDATPSVAEHKLPVAPPAKVLSWDLMYDNNGDGDLLFAGTEDGAWQLVLNGGSWEPGSFQRIAGTEGDAIIMTEAEVLAGYQFAAFLSPLALYIYETTSGPNLISYPFHAGLPGEVTGMALYVYGSSVYLMISGEEGLVFVYVSGLPV